MRKKDFDRYFIEVESPLTKEQLIDSIEVEAGSPKNALIIGRHAFHEDRKPFDEPRPFRLRRHQGGPIVKSPQASIRLNLRSLSDANKVWGRPSIKPPDAWAARNIETVLKRRK